MFIIHVHVHVYYTCTCTLNVVHIHVHVRTCTLRDSVVVTALQCVCQPTSDAGRGVVRETIITAQNPLTQHVNQSGHHL